MKQRVSKVLVLAYTFPAVSETFVIDHVLGLARSGLKVTVAAWHVDEAALSELRRKSGIDLCVRAIERSSSASRLRLIGIALWRLLPIYPPGIFSAWVRDLTLASEGLTKLARQIHPDLIHAHFGPNGITAAFTAKRFSIPLVVNFHGFDVTTVTKKHGWMPYRRLLASAQGVAHSSFVQERVRIHLGIPVHRVSLGVDTSVFSAPERVEKWPEKLEFLFVGRLVYQKGAHVAIAMLSIFKRHFPEYVLHLTICGDGPEQDYLRQCAFEFGVEDSISFTGAVPYATVSEQMRKADILLIPSVPVASGAEEAFCRVAIEGMAMGLAVIGSETGGLQETIGSGGSTFRAGSAMALFNQVERLLVHSNPKEEAKRACERAQEFSIQRMDEEYASITH